MPRFKLRRLKMLLSRKSNCRLKLKRRRYSWNLWTGVLWAEETARKHGQVGRGKREGRGGGCILHHSPLEPEKRANILRCHHWFPAEMSPEKRAQKFHTDDESLPRSGTASGWSCRLWNLLQPIRSSTPIWVVTHDQYEISVLIYQTLVSLGCLLFTQNSRIEILCKRIKL